MVPTVPEKDHDTPERDGAVESITEQSIEFALLRSRSLTVGAFAEDRLEAE